MRLFQLHRDEDMSGVSGTGVVAEGVEFTNRECMIHWLAKKSSLGIYTSIDDLIKIHGHEGKTRVVWVEATFVTKPPATAYVEPETSCTTCGSSPKLSNCAVKCDV